MRPQNKYFTQYSITNPAYNVARIAGQYIRDRSAKYFSGRMLEVGCGTKAKGLLVGQFVDEHIGLDHKDCPHDQSNIDIFGTAYDIPVKNASYDCVLSTAVLEHLEEPQQALREAYRTLKPGGYALYTMPLFWHLHEQPRDFFRYTKYGLQHLFRTAGFEIIEITPLSGFWVTFGTELNYYIQRFKWGPVKYLIVVMTICGNWLFPKLDQGFLRDERFTWMYLVVARRPKGT
jgi:ubiquinone/menaquinone biosynthesis C-methylase UbiE